MTVPTFIGRVRGRTKRELKKHSADLNNRLSTDQERAQTTRAAFRDLPTDLVREDIIDRFHQIYYDDGPARGATWRKTTWLGTTVWKCPLDLWLYQELIHRLRPDLIIETGT